jgi:hypothetical protein
MRRLDFRALTLGWIRAPDRLGDGFWPSVAPCSIMAGSIGQGKLKETSDGPRSRPTFRLLHALGLAAGFFLGWAMAHAMVSAEAHLYVALSSPSFSLCSRTR